jgi:hypothetical protein
MRSIVLGDERALIGDALDPHFFNTIRQLQ